jgi:hypothetical protein
VDWMHLAQDRDQWWAVVNTVVNLLSFIEGREFFTEWLLASQK